MRNDQACNSTKKYYPYTRQEQGKDCKLGLRDSSYFHVGLCGFLYYTFCNRYQVEPLVDIM